MALVFDGILHSTPPPVTKVNPHLPVALENILAKMLEKEKELRYQTATEIRADFEASETRHRFETLGHSTSTFR